MSGRSDVGRAHLRIARPSDDLDAVIRFYGDGLGFVVLGRFFDHDGFDGVMLGHEAAPYHLEFTHHRGHPAGRAPTRENLLIFYLPDRDAWQATVAQLERAGHASVAPLNPYWGRHGRTYEDPDGYLVVLENAFWSNRDTSAPAR